jgi:hypothetical protein
MSWFTSLMGFFTGNSTADSIVDGVKRASDMLVFTPEEKAITNQKTLELYIKYQEATLPQNVTRRYIAITVVILWAIFLFFAFLLNLAGLFGDWESFLKASDFTFKLIKENINSPFEIIIGFYYLKRIIQN